MQLIIAALIIFKGSVIMGIGYKLFAVNKKHKGELFPLYVNANENTPINKWVEAKCGEMKDGKVKSKLGLLAYRPAWHLSDLPIAKHMGIKDDNGKIKYMRPDVVWCECEYSDTINYQEEANHNGMIKGKLVPKLAYLNYIPVNGFYKYKTNPNMFGEWILAGEIKVNKVMTDEEVNQILVDKGITPMERYGGEMKLCEYGF